MIYCDYVPCLLEIDCGKGQNTFILNYRNLSNHCYHEKGDYFPLDSET